MIKIIIQRIDKRDLKHLCDDYFKSFVKIVVDIEQNIMAVGGELHADAEAILIDQGSKQSELWGANFYPFKKYEDRLEYTALINIRPRDDNSSMEILSKDTREKVRQMCNTYLLDSNESL